MPSPVASGTKAAVPLCVDLDGTLIKSDTLWEALLRLLKRNPLYGFAVPIWLLRGRAHLKTQLAARVKLDAALLPYHEQFLEFLRAEKLQGRPLVLVTASNARFAQEVAEHLKLFTEVLASDDSNNLRGKTKAAKLAERFGERGFDYAGNSSVDLAVWARARQAIVVNGSSSLEARAAKRAPVQAVFGASKSRLRAFFQALRPHQWMKNLIIFVPLVTSHQLTRGRPALDTVLAFAAFSFCASAVYVLNDLFDLDADRQHSTKRLRPFASGDLPLPAGMITLPLLIAASLVVAASLPLRFMAVLAGYFVLTTSYSWWLKRVPLLDVFCLAGLYTIRLIAGQEATGIVCSFWLLAFSMFIFLSLALVKRFVELAEARQQSRPSLKGRGYLAGDLEMVAIFGPTSGYLAALVLALYVNSQEVRVLYRHPTALLLICPLLLYWVSRVWLLAHRRQMHEDPIVFALRDRASYLVGALTLAVIWLAA